MQPVGSLRPRRLGTATALIAVLGAAVPATAHADTSSPNWTAIIDSSACQFNGVSITSQAPLQTLPSTSATPTLLSVSASGTCTGATGSRGFTMGGTANSAVLSPSCTAITGSGTGSLQIGGFNYTVEVAIAGPTASLQLVMLIADSSLTGGEAIAQLSITAASLQACLRGGTTSLDYTGAVVFTF